MDSHPPRLTQRANRPWVKTVSGIAVVTAASGSLPVVTAAAAGPDLSVTSSQPQRRQLPTLPTTVGISPTAVGPRFTLPWRRTSSPLEKLEAQRHLLRRQLSQTETRLAQLQHLLALEVYGQSFADDLLKADQAYQRQLNELLRLEAQGGTTQAAEQRLQHLAQAQIAQYIDANQTDSALWQEPMYHSSLGWLMEATHQRHLLLARQQTVAQGIERLQASYTASRR